MHSSHSILGIISEGSLHWHVFRVENRALNRQVMLFKKMKQIKYISRTSYLFWSLELLDSCCLFIPSMLIWNALSFNIICLLLNESQTLLNELNHEKNALMLLKNSFVTCMTWNELQVQLSTRSFFPNSFSTGYYFQPKSNKKDWVLTHWLAKSLAIQSSVGSTNCFRKDQISWRINRSRKQMIPMEMMSDRQTSLSLSFTSNKLSLKCKFPDLITGLTVTSWWKFLSLIPSESRTGNQQEKCKKIRRSYVKS